MNNLPVNRRELMRVASTGAASVPLFTNEVLGQTSGVQVDLRQIERPDFPRVSVFATVTDQAGSVLTNLTASNFDVMENDTRNEPIVSVIQPDETGSNAVATSLVIDRSGSMTGPGKTRLKDAKAGATEFISNFGSDDQGLVIAFDDATDIEIRNRWTRDTDALEAAVNGIRSGGSTALFDAVIKSVEEATERVGRSAVIVLADGQDNDSTNSIDAAVDRATQENVPIYTIGLGNSLDPDALETLATDTGGEFYSSADGSDLAAIYQAIKASITNEYEIRYETGDDTTDGNERTVKLTATTGGTSGSDTGTYTEPCAPLPTAAIDVPDEVRTGDSTTFDGGDSQPNGGRIDSYAWDFTNDGSQDATGATATHTYSDPGNYEARLTVKKTCGARDVALQPVFVFDDPISVYITGTNAPIEAGETLQVQAEVENAGNPSAAVAVELFEFTGDRTDVEVFRADRGTRTPIELEWETEAADAGTGSIAVRVGSREVTATIEITGPRRSPLAGTDQKIATAEKIDSRSVLAALESRAGTTIEGDTELIQATVDNLQQAVNNDNLDRQTAEEAIQRLQALEDASLLTVHRMGPQTPDGGGFSENINIAERTARPTIATTVKVILSILTIKILALSSLGAVGTGILGGSLALISDGVSKILSVMMGSDGEGEGDTSLKQEAETQCRSEARGLVTQIKDGGVKTGQELVDAIDSIVDDLVDLFADGIRATVELAQVDVAIKAASIGPVPSFTDLLAGGSSVYGSLSRTDQALGASQLQSTGLSGSTATVVESLEEGQQQLATKINDGVNTLDSLEAFSADINLWQSLINATTAADPPIEQILDIVTTIASALKNGIIGILSSAATALSGYGLISYIKRVHGEFAAAAIEGREVNLPDV